MSAGRYGEELFIPDEAGEATRIDYGALAYDPMSRARLTALGVGPGWRCLDLGAGTGTIANWLAATAGAAEVLAVDRDTRFLTGRATSTLKVRSADITAADFQPGTFDLVHARFVLMHLPGYRGMLARMADWVTPGGWLVVSDAVDLSTEGAPETPYRNAMRAMWLGLRELIGTDVSWTPHYPYLLKELPFTDIGTELYVPPLLPGHPITTFWLQTWERMRPAMLAHIDAEQLATARESLRSPSCAGLSPGMITAWGRRIG